jgi:hypothetical protein
MNLEITDFIVECNGRHYNRRSCPNGIRPVVEKAVGRGQLEGTVAGGGRLWHWNALPPEVVNVEIVNRDGSLLEVHPIPSSGWAAFCVVSKRRRLEPKHWLAELLGQAMADGFSIEQGLHYLFPARPDEEPHFEVAQRNHWRVE